MACDARNASKKIEFHLLCFDNNPMTCQKTFQKFMHIIFQCFLDLLPSKKSSLNSKEILISKESSKGAGLENIEKLYAQNYERSFQKSWDCCQSRANGMRYFFSLTFKYYIKWGLPSFSITYYKSIGSTYIHILTSFDCFKRLVGKSSISFLTLLNIHECDLVSMGNKQASSSSADRLSRPRHRFFHVIVF